MSHPSPEPVPVPTSPIHHLYLTAASMRHLAETLPENLDGLAHIIDRLGRDVELVAVILDDSEREE